MRAKASIWLRGSVGFSSSFHGHLWQCQGPVAVSLCWGKGCACEPLLSVLYAEGSQTLLGLPGQLGHPPQGWPRRFFWCQPSLCLPGGALGSGEWGWAHCTYSPHLGPRLVFPESLLWPYFQLPASGAGSGPVSPPHPGPGPRQKLSGPGSGHSGMRLLAARSGPER